MKKNSIKLAYLAAGLILSVFISSCSNEEWDRHYNNEDLTLSDKSLSEYIKSQPEMEKFYQMMEISGYDSILDGSQTYTVWVPTNEALQNVNLSDASAVKELVMNHITRFSQPTSGVTDKKLLMLSNKFVHFAKEGSNYLFGESPLVIKNIATKNGIIHSISKFEKYESNLWESLSKLENLDSLRNFYNFYIKTDENGKSQNLVLNTIGRLDLEDSIYTAIFPTNKAWLSSYNIIKEYYKVRQTDGTVTTNWAVASQAIVLNTVFRQKINPFALDSVFSTIGNVFKNPGRLFENATPVSASNGQIYLTDSLMFQPQEGWHNEIRIEAEETYYGRSSTNANVYFRSSEGTKYSTSSRRYIVVDPTTSSNISKIAVTFPIPNTLSAKYKIYCVFVPENIADENSKRTFVASFFLDYMNSSGAIVRNQPLAANVETKVDEVTKVYVGEIKFPFCSIYNGSNSDIQVKLKVENAVRTNQTTTKSRSMRIDCIILEPVD